MTQNDFDFLRTALLGKCDGLLREIVENDKLRKLAEQKAEEQAKTAEETKGEENE